MDPCSLLSKGLVETTVSGAVGTVRELTPDDFLSPPPSGFVACAYSTDTRYGQVLVSVQPSGRDDYEAQYVERDPTNTREVPNLGEDARFSVCGSLSVFSNGRVLQLGIQFADCKALPRLVSLAQVAIRRL